MAKTMLLPKFEAYILSSTGSQSIGMMKKIESIAKKNCFIYGFNRCFLNELVKSANSEGFRHDPASYSYSKLYSGSSLATVNSNFDGSRGRRSRLNFYDEASYVSRRYVCCYSSICPQNSDLALRRC